MARQEVEALAGLLVYAKENPGTLWAPGLAAWSSLTG
jgi:hypothetical protein